MISIVSIVFEILQAGFCVLRQRQIGFLIIHRDMSEKGCYDSNLRQRIVAAPTVTSPLCSIFSFDSLFQVSETYIKTSSFSLSLQVPLLIIFLLTYILFSLISFLHIYPFTLQSFLLFIHTFSFAPLFTTTTLSSENPN